MAASFAVVTSSSAAFLGFRLSRFASPLIFSAFRNNKYLPFSFYFAHSPSSFSSLASSSSSLRWQVGSRARMASTACAALGLTKPNTIEAPQVALTSLETSMSFFFTFIFLEARCSIKCFRDRSVSVLRLGFLVSMDLICAAKKSC
jgi:hypothetical protein